jgi:Tol biopolymer transport system component
MPPRLTRDSSFDWPAGWTKDSREILFFSDRNGTVQPFQTGRIRKKRRVGRSGKGTCAECADRSGRPSGFSIWFGPRPGRSA